MEKVKGYIDHIIYQNRENGYAVISFVEEKVKGEWSALVMKKI